VSRFHLEHKNHGAWLMKYAKQKLKRQNNQLVAKLVVAIKKLLSTLQIIQRLYLNISTSKLFIKTDTLNL